MGIALIATGAERVEQLKHEVAIGGYEIDAPAVADAILEKLWLVKQGQIALARAAGRSRPAAGPRRLHG